MTKKQIIWTIIFIIATVALWVLTEDSRKADNKYQCAVYGYYEDCKTPLPEELKLK